jgi:hypothetical protein
MSTKSKFLSISINYQSITVDLPLQARLSFEDDIARHAYLEVHNQAASAKSMISKKKFVVISGNNYIAQSVNAEA